MQRIKVALASLLVFISTNSFAAGGPYADTKVARVDSKIVQEFPKYNFLESLLSAEDGSIYVTSAYKGIIYRVKDGNYSELANYEGKLQGITFMDSERILATGTTPDKEQMIAEIDIATGELDIVATVPEGKMLNGLTKYQEGKYLIADSIKGVIWEFDISSGAVSIWADDEILKGSKSLVLGANGIKKFHNDIYVTNTGKMMLVKIPLEGPRKAEVVKDKVLLDDFAMDADGNVYGATHVFHSVVKISNTGDIEIIAQKDQGVAGSTALTWKYGVDNTLLVSSHGDMKNKDKTKVETAKIVQLNLN